MLASVLLPFCMRNATEETPVRKVLDPHLTSATPIDGFYLINGSRDAALDVRDRGLYYGDGIFETIAVVAGYAELLEEHLSRLEKGCARLGIPCQRPLLSQEISDAAQSLGEGVLKAIVTRGVGQRGYRPSIPSLPNRIIVAEKFPLTQFRNKNKPARVRICSHRLPHHPPLAGIKHLNRLDQVLARTEWADDYDEGLMIDSKGKIIEGTMSNIFFLNENRDVATPIIDGCGVEGIMRGHIIQKLEGRGVSVQLLSLTLQDIMSYQAAFLTNSIIQIWPISSIENDRRDTVLAGEFAQKYELFSQLKPGI